MTPEQLAMLRRLALSDPKAVGWVMTGSPESAALLDAKTAAMVRVAAISALHAEGTALPAAIDAARAAGASDDELRHAISATAAVVGVRAAEAALGALDDSADRW